MANESNGGVWLYINKNGKFFQRVSFALFFFFFSCFFCNFCRKFHAFSVPFFRRKTVHFFPYFFLFSLLFFTFSAAASPVWQRKFFPQKKRDFFIPAANKKRGNTDVFRITSPGRILFVGTVFVSVFGNVFSVLNGLLIRRAFGTVLLLSAEKTVAVTVTVASAAVAIALASAVAVA